MRIYLKILSIILLLTFSGCSGFLSSPEDETSNSSSNNGNPGGLKIQILNPNSSDTINYVNQIIEYKVEGGASVNFIEVHVNGEFLENFQPVDGTNPLVKLNLNSSFIGQRIKLFLIYFDKNGSNTKSNEVTNLYVEKDRIAPYSPYNFTATRIGESIINLSWKDSTLGDKTYEIWRKRNDEAEFSKLLTASANMNNVNDYEIQTGFTYFYKIRSFNNIGYSIFSSIISSTGGTGSFSVIPPSNLIAEATDTRVVKLTWEDNSSNENYFKVERTDANYNIIQIVGFVEKNKTIFTDSLNGLFPGNEYNYRVKAISSSDSSWSAWVNVTTPAYTLKAPTLLTISLASGKVNITWKDNDSKWSSFDIERKTSYSSFVKISTIEGYLTNFIDLDVISGFTYTYRVIANDGTVVSPYSNELTIYVP